MNVRMSRLLFLGLALCMMVLCYFYFALPSGHQTNCDCKDNYKERKLSKAVTSHVQEAKHFKDRHNMAVLVPFRDRFDELMLFAPHLNKFLNSQKKNNHIFIINQVDGLRFNRASLLNVGVKEVSSKGFDHMALHDVDLLPLNPKLLYHYPDEGPYHVAAPHLHPRYHYPTFIGGVLIIKKDHFIKVNGMSNKYWGWGLEDDEFYARLKETNLKIFRPGNLTTGTKSSFKHAHNRKIRRRDMIKCYNQQEITRRRDRQTGLSSTKYTLQSQKELVIDGTAVTVLNVILHCNRTSTPWCDCTGNYGNKPPTQQNYANKTDLIAPKINRKKHISPDG